ncbi:MAG TPA: VWA domain-containing protein [Bryobacteraceae bacterium]|nr:VWA domain-containing protein [Bryobacteraceae bacterium]
MRFRGIALILLCIGAIGVRAQTDASGSPRFRADSTLVLVPVAVTDAANRYVLGLEKGNFKLTEDGTEQTIAHFSAEDAPLSVGLIVDVSGSIGAKLATSRQAVREFLKTLNAGDEAFLVECSDQAELTLRFTQDTGVIEQKLGAATSGGLTALLDAVHLGLQEMKNAKNPRKALLIISDGGENNSQFTSKQIEGLVREADVQIYAMGVFEPITIALSVAEIGGPRVLSEISEQTGGRALAAPNLKELPGIAARIGLELRNQYVLAYSPTNRTRDGAYRKVQVKLLPPPELPPLKARWRLGYYAPSE